MFNVVLGAGTVSIGLTFWQALLAIAVGTLIGARRLFWATYDRLIARRHR